MRNQAAPTYQLFGEFLALSWADSHESMLGLRMLREACPCAHCRGEPDLLGRRIMPAQQDQHGESSYQVTALSPVGLYGIQFTWGDGHYTGIYTFEYLRRLCDCDICRAESETAAP